MAYLRRIRIVVLISGEGSNLQALLDACENGPLAACTIVSVISNRKTSGGIAKAEEASITTYYHGMSDYKKAYPDADLAKYKYAQDLASVALSEDPDMIVCAGFPCDLGSSFLDSIAAFSIPAINLHPSLPPPDLIESSEISDEIAEAHRQWKEHKLSMTGVMVHEITSRTGRGRSFFWERIEFEDGKDRKLESFRERIHNLERKVIVEGTRKAIEFYGLPRNSMPQPF